MQPEGSHGEISQADAYQEIQQHNPARMYHMGPSFCGSSRSVLGQRALLDDASRGTLRYDIWTKNEGGLTPAHHSQLALQGAPDEQVGPLVEQGRMHDERLLWECWSLLNLKISGSEF